MPVTRSVNGQMRTVESKVRPLIAKQDKLYHYTSTATYDDKRTDEDERSIPTSIKIEWGVIDGKKEPPEGPFSQGLPTRKGPPDLNSVGRDILEKKGISNNRLARDIVRCRTSFRETESGFKDFKDLVEKLRKYYAQELTPRKKNDPYPETYLKELDDLI